MAVNLFTIEVNGTSYTYTDAGTWLDNNGNLDPSIGSYVHVSNTKNSDGTYTVTVDKKALSSTGSGTTVTLTDNNAYDRQTYRLALGSGYSSNELYGGRQSVSYSTSGTDTTLTISGINSGLFVSADGKSIAYDTAPLNGSATVTISYLSNPGSSNVTVKGKTITIESTALGNTQTVSLTDSTNTYTLALGTADDAIISTYTEAGWASVAAGSASGIFYSAGRTKGYYIANTTQIATAINYSAAGGGNTELFRVTGLSSGTTAPLLNNYFDVSSTDQQAGSDAYVSLTSAGFSALQDLAGSESKTIIFKDATGGLNYSLALNSAVNTTANPKKEGWVSETDTAYDYQTAGNDAYASLTSGGTNNGHSDSLTVYAEKESKSFTINGLSSGHKTDGSVSVVAGDNDFTVTLGQSALAKQNVYASGDYASIVSFSAAAGVTTLSPTLETGATLNSGTLTYQVAGGSGTGYDFSQKTYVVYNASGSYGGQRFTLAGLSGTGATLDTNTGVITTNNATLGTVTQQIGSTTTARPTLDIALTESAFNTAGGSITITSATGSFDYNLSLGDTKFYTNSSVAPYSASALTYDSDGYLYTGGHSAAYFNSPVTATSLASGGSAVYTYHAATDHAAFGLSGSIGTIFDTTKAYGYYFTVDDSKVTSGSGSYIVNFTQSGIGALSSVSGGVTMTIVDKDSKNTTYVMAGLPSSTLVPATFGDSVSSGAINFYDEYQSEGWSAVTAGDSTSFIHIKAANQGLVFTLSGLESLNGASFTYTPSGGGISYTKSGTSYAFGTLSSTGYLALDAGLFGRESLTSITLTDNDLTTKFYGLSLGSLSEYGLNNKHATAFTTLTGTGGYSYTSGGLSAGYGLTRTFDSEGASAGTTTITKYDGTAITHFTISGLSTGIGTSAVLDYASINSANYAFYLTGTSALAKGNYLLTSDITLDSALTISDNVAFNLNGHNIVGASGTVFNVTGGELIIDGSGYIDATSASNATAINVSSGANFILNGGSIEGSQYGISAAGNVYITGGDVRTNSDGTYGINMTSGNLVVTGGTVNGQTTAINMGGGKLDVTGGTITGTTTGINVGVGSLNVVGGTITGGVGLSVGSTTGTVNVLGGTVTSNATGGFAIVNSDNDAVNIGRANVGSLGSGSFAIFADYDGKSYGSIGGRQQTYTGSYSSHFVYSGSFSSILSSVKYPTFTASAAVVVGASGETITLNRAALYGGSSVVSLTSAGDYKGLALGSDVTTFDNREDPTRVEGWTLTGVEEAGDSSVNTATYQTTNYLESWALSGTAAVVHYDATGGASINLSGLSNIVANGTSIALTEASLGSFFKVDTVGLSAAGGYKVTGYTLTVQNQASLFGALDQDEKLTFTFNGGNDGFGARGVSVAFATGITGYRTAIDDASVITNTYTHSAAISVGSSYDTFLYTASGVDDYYHLVGASTAGGSATLEHVKTVGLTQFSLSGLGDKFSAFSTSVAGTSTLLLGTAGGSVYTIGSVNVSETIGTVTLYEAAFNTSLKSSQTITLTDLNMSDGVYYTLGAVSGIYASTAEGVGITQTLVADSYSAGGYSSYTFILGGSNAFYTLTNLSGVSGVEYNGSTVSQSSTQIVYTPQVGGQSFMISGLVQGLSLSGDNITIINGTTVVGSISVGSAVVYGGTDSINATLTLTDVAAMGTLASGASVPFAFKDSDSLDSVAYSLALSSVFNEVSAKAANPDVEATFASVTGGYSYAAPTYKNYTLSHGSGSYTYYAPTDALTFNITGLSSGLAASGAYSIATDTETGITTITNGGASTLAVTAGASGRLSILVYESALSAVAERGNITVTMGTSSIYGFGFSDSLGLSGVEDSAGVFGSTAGGSFTYTGAIYSDYYSFASISSAVSTVNAMHHAPAGGESFVFSGVSTGDFAKGINDSIIAVTTTAGLSNGGYSIVGYKFQVNDVTFLKTIPQGSTFSVSAVDWTPGTGGLSLTIASDILTSNASALVRAGTHVAGASTLKPSGSEGDGPASASLTSAGLLEYTASLNAYDWYSYGDQSITHNPQSGGQTFSLSGINTLYSSDYTFRVNTGAGATIRAFDSSSNGTNLAMISASGTSRAYVYLAKEAFSSVGSTITLIDGDDGTGSNVMLYSLSTTTAKGYLDSYTGNYGSASFVAGTTSGTYNFTASGITQGIEIASSSTAAGLSVTTATYRGASGAQAFTIAGLSFGMTGLSIAASDSLTAIKFSDTGGASVIDVTGISTGAINVMVYEGALSAGRGDIVLTGTTSGITYSLSLAEKLTLIDNEKPYYVGGTSEATISTTITLGTGGGTSTWTSEKYSDYYIVGDGDTTITATHYASVGGYSFTFGVSGVTSQSFTGSISIAESASLGSDNQFAVNGFVFGISKAGLSTLDVEGETLYVTAGNSSFTGSYGFSFIGTDAADIRTSAAGGGASLTSVGSGTYDFTAAVSQYAYYQQGTSGTDVRSITYHEQIGGQSFRISGLASNLSALSYDASTGIISAGNATVGMVTITAGATSAAASVGTVYLTAAAFGSVGNTTITLTDSKDGDGIDYKLAAYSDTVSGYLATTRADHTNASFASLDSSGSYLYTAAITGEGVSLATNGSSTTLTYIAQYGGESFRISGLTSGLAASTAVAGNVTNVIDTATGVVLGAVSGATFTLESRVAVGALSAGKTTTIRLTDNNTYDSIDYALDIDTLAFNYRSDGTRPSAIDSVSASEEGSTGIYNVQTSGTPAYTENYGTNAYLYHAVGSGDAYMVTGLSSGLASTSGIFGTSAVTITAGALPGSVTTIQIVNDTTGKVTLTPASVIAGESLQSLTAANIKGTNYTLQAYRPWYSENTGTTLKVYPSVGGETVSLTGFRADLTASGNYIVSGTSVASVDVSLNADTGEIAKYKFTVSGKSALSTTIADGGTISIGAPTAYSGAYELVIEDTAIDINTGSSLAPASLVPYGSDTHTYISTTRKEYVAAGASADGGYVHAYTYHASTPSIEFNFSGLSQGETSLLGNDVFVQENWSGNTLQSANITLLGGALGYRGNIAFTSTNALFGGGVSFTVHESLRAKDFEGGFSGTGGSYVYQTSGTEEGYVLTTTNDSVQALEYSTMTGGQSFSLTGLSAGLGALSVSSGGILYAETSGGSIAIGTFTGSNISITNAAALGNRDITFIDHDDAPRAQFPYTFTLAESLVTASDTPASIVQSFDDDTFGEMVYMAGWSGAKYTMSDTVDATTNASIRTYAFTAAESLGHNFQFGGTARNKNLTATNYTFAVSDDGSITATEGNNTPRTVAVVNNSASTVTVYKPAFSETATTGSILYLDYTDGTSASAGYQLSLGSDLDTATDIVASVATASGGVYSFQEAGNTDGYDLVSYNGVSNAGISFIAASGGNRFQLSGLKESMNLSISGTAIYDSNASVAIASYGYNSVESTYDIVLNDNAFDYNNASASFTVRLSDVSKADGNLYIGNFDFGISSTLYATDLTEYAPAGESFVGGSVQSSSGGYSIAYQANARNAYWSTRVDGSDQDYLYTFMPTLAASDRFVLGGFSSSVTGSDFTVNNGTTLPGSGSYAVNVTDSLLPNASNSVITLTDSDSTDGYDFYFAATDAQASVVYASGSAPAQVDANFKETSGTYTFTADYTREYVSLDGGASTLTYVAAVGGQSFMISGLADGLQMSLAGTSVLAVINSTTVTIGSLSNGVLTLENLAALGTVANGASRTITLTDLDNTDGVDYSLSLGSAFNYQDTDLQESDAVSGASGTYVYTVGAVSAYTTDSVTGGTSQVFYQYTFKQATEETTFDFTGLADGLSGNTTAFGREDDAFKLTTTAIDGASVFTFKVANASYSNFHVVTGQERETVDANFFVNTSASRIDYRNESITAGYDSVTSDLTTTFTYKDAEGGVSLFAVTGLGASFIASGMNYSVDGSNVYALGTSSTQIGTLADNTLTLNAKATLGADDTLQLVSVTSSDYSLALASTGTDSINQEYKHVDPSWDDDTATNVVSYTNEKVEEYWSLTSANTYTHTEQAGGSVVFSIQGLSATKDDLANVVLESISGGYKVTIPDELLIKTEGAQVSITSGNQLAFDGIKTVATAYDSVGAFNGSTYSIVGHAAEMVAASSLSDVYTYTAAATSYAFGITATGVTFNGSSISAAVAGSSVIFTNRNNNSVGAYLDKTTNTVVVNKAIFNDTTKATVSIDLTDNLGNVSIAAGDLDTTRNTDSQSNYWTVPSANTVYYQEGKVASAYYRVSTATLEYVTQSGGNTFRVYGLPSAYQNAASLAGALSVASDDGINYTFTVNDTNLLTGGGIDSLLVSVRAAADDISVALAVNSTIGNNEASVVAPAFTSNVYTATGTLSYYQNVSNDVKGVGATASLQSVEATGFETFTISGLSDSASLKALADGSGIAKDATTYVGISGANVYLTSNAFAADTITLADKKGDEINYGLAYGDGNYLASLGDFTPEDFSSSDGTYNYSASYRAEGILLTNTTLATHYAEVGAGETFKIIGLADNLSLSGGNILAGDVTVGTLNDHVLTLTGLSALSSAAQDLGATTTFTLTNTSTAVYSLSVTGALAVTDATLIAETLTGGAASGYEYAAAHSSAYVTAGASNSYTYGAEEKYDTFNLSGSGLASGLTLSGLSISGKTVTLTDAALNASPSAGYTINFTAVDGDGDGNYYTINALDARTTIDAHFAGNGSALAYLNTAVSAGWNGEGGSKATFTYSDVTGGESLFTVTGLGASFTGTSVSYAVNGANNVTADGVMIGGFSANTLTLNQTALAGASFVQLSGSGYSLQITGVATSAAVLAQSAFVDDTYYSAALSSYWSASGVNAYNFNDAAPSAAQFSVAGAVSLADTLVSGTTVTLNEDNLAGASVTLTNLSTASYALALGGSVAQSATDASGWTDVVEGKAAYMLGASTAYYTLSDTTHVNYTAAVAGESTVVLSGLASGASLAAPAEGIVNLTATDFGTGVKVENNAGSYAFSLATGDYASKSFTGTADADTVNNGGSNIAINVGAGNDSINLAAGTGATLTLGDGNDTISVGAGVTEFTVTDFSTDDVIVGSFSALSAIDGGITDGNVTIKGITEVAGTSYTWTPGTDNLAYVSTSTSGATLDGNKITLVGSEGGTSTLFTVYGVSSTLGVALNESVVTLGQSALNTKQAGASVSLTGDGYSLELSGVAQSAVTISPAGFVGATYSASALSAYWGTLGTNAYILNASTEGAAQFSIAGAVSLADTIVGGTTVTLGAANLTGTSVTLTNLSTAAYSLALDGTQATVTNYSASFTAVDNKSASYLGAGNTAGYSLAGDTLIAYTPEVKQQTLFTLAGISTITNDAVSGTSVILGTANFAGTNITLTDGASSDYTLTLDGDYAATATSAVGFVQTGASATYTGEGMTEGYALSGTKTVVHSDAIAGSVLFTVNGISTIDNSALSGTTVTLGESNFAGTDITLTNTAGNSYSLALDKDYAQTTTEGGFGSLVDGAATYYGEGTSDGYALSGATLIAHTAGQSGTELFTASNITSTDNVSYAASAITAANETGAKLTLTNLSSALTIDGFVEIDGLNATNQTVAGTPTDAAASGDNLVVTTVDGAITIDGAAATTVNMAGDSAAYTAAFDRITDVTDTNAKSVTLTAGFEKSYYGLHYSYGTGVTAVDATKANTTALNLTGFKQSDDLTLTGASAATNSLTGGSGNDTLTGGGQGDLLKGNAGNDVFVQSAGTDTISDYTENEDTIQLISTLDTTAADSTNVTLTTADGNAIVVTNGVGQVIKTVDSTGNEDYILYLPEAPTNASVSGEDLIVTADKDYTFAGASAATVTVFTSDGGTYTAEKTRITDITDDAKEVTLTTDFTNTYYGLHQSYGKGVTAVDATQANTSTLNLTGYKQSDDLTLTGATNATNTIIGGSGNDTLTGGGQGDSLKGNAGNDLFVQSAGNDTITDYTEGEDAIQLLSNETGRETVDSDVVITTADGTIRILNGSGKDISIIGGEDTVVSGTPIDSKADGDDLLVTLAGGTTTTFAGQANDTVTMSAGDHNYSVQADRITDYTTDDKAVTLTSGFEKTYYGLHQSYGKGVTAVDATNANTSTLNLTGYKSTDDLTLTGATNAANSLTGGSGNDTLTGGGQGDLLKGNAGNDVFVQSAGNDTISDYTAGEDVISLVSAYSTGTVSGSDVILTTEDGNTIQLTGGKGQSITVDYNGTTDTLYFDSETPTVEGAPVDVTLLASGNLSIELANGDTITVEGTSTTMEAGGNNYSVTSDRITDYTDTTDKKVTLASGFTNTYYGLHQSYGSGVTAVDATKATSATTLSLTGYKSTSDLTLTGAPNATNNITGGKGNDTLTGGTANDTLKGNAGADVFVQSAGNDTITDYTAGEDVIALASEVTARAIDANNVTLTTAEGTIVVQNGADQPITLNIDGSESTVMYVSEVPTDAKADGDNLVVTTAKGDFTMGGASDTVHVYTADNTYKVAFDRITDITTTDTRTVTLTTGFTNTYYGLHYSYANGVTTVDATNANTDKLTLTGTKSTVAVALTGTDGAPNSIIGGHANDTLTGGSGNDTLKGNAGADLFVQSGGDDVIVDYTEEDTIQLLGAATAETVDADVTFTNDTGKLTVLNGSTLSITTTVVSGSANIATTNDELWGVNGVKDTFLFDGGNDTIHNYEEQDSINLGSFALSDLVSGAPSVKDSSLVFEFNKQNSFTVVDAVGKTVSFTDGTTYSKK